MSNHMERPDLTFDQNKNDGLKNALQELRDLGVSDVELIGVDRLEVGGEGLSGHAGNRDWCLKRQENGDYIVITGPETDNIAGLIEVRRGRNEGLTEEERTQIFWKAQLQHEVRIETPQTPECEFAIVVPVYNETPERILKQIDSLRSQQKIDRSVFEVIYVINNDLPNESAKSTESIVANQKLIDTLRGISDLNIFVVDKSSPGNEIRDCNVGKARNRGIAEASLRFHEKGKNGILIQTDADTYFEDPEYLAKLRTMMNENLDCIGVAGGLIFELNPDAKSDKELAEFRGKLEVFILKKKWEALVQFLRDPDSALSLNFFCGANMISRSYESAIIGGVLDATAGEDPQFGLDLEAYAAGRGQSVKEAKNTLLVVTALRDSDRTTASFKKEFDQIDLKKPFLVSDPFVAETLPQFREKFKNILSKENFVSENLRQMMIDEKGKLIVSEHAFSEIVEHIQQNGFSEENDFFRKWTAKNFMPGFDFIRLLYDLQHPQIPLTTENFERLVAAVVQEPKGLEMVSGLDIATIGGKIRVSW